MGRAKRGCGRVGDKFWTEEKSSFGFKYLSKLGWKPGEGMGATKQGRNKYVHVTVRRENQGLGKKEYTSNEHFKATINMYNDLLTSIQKRCNRGDDDSSSEEEDKHAGRFMSAREMIQRDRAKSFYKRFHLARNQGSTMKEDLAKSKARASTQKVNGFTEEDQTNIALKLAALSGKTPGKKGLGFGSTNLVKNSYVKEYVKAKGIRIAAGDSKTITKRTGGDKKKKKSKKRDSKRKKGKKRGRSSDRKRRKASRKRKEKKKKRRKKVDSITSESKLEAEAMRIAEQLLKCKKTEKRQSKQKSEQKKRKAERKLEREKKKKTKKEASQSSDEILLRQPVLSWSTSVEEEALRIAGLLGSCPVTKAESTKESKKKKKKKKKRFKTGRDEKS